MDGVGASLVTIRFNLPSCVAVLAVPVLSAADAGTWTAWTTCTLVCMRR